MYVCMCDNKKENMVFKVQNGTRQFVRFTRRQVANKFFVVVTAMLFALGWFLRLCFLLFPTLFLLLFFLCARGRACAICLWLS